MASAASFAEYSLAAISGLKEGQTNSVHRLKLSDYLPMAGGHQQITTVRTSEKFWCGWYLTLGRGK